MLDSDAEAEYEEMVLKAAAALRAVARVAGTPVAAGDGQAPGG